MAKQVIITDKAELGKLIKNISTAGAKLDGMIQQAGVSSLHHLLTGDVMMVNTLYLALNKGTRKTALASWLLSHGALIANAGEGKDQKPFMYTKDKTTNVEAAQQDSWFSHKPDAAPDETFDLQKAINAIIKKAQGKELLHGDLLTGLQALVTVPDVEQQAADHKADEVPAQS